MKQSGNHTIQKLVLWLGIFTALLLIFGMFSNSADPIFQLEINETTFNNFPGQKVKIITSLVYEWLQWLNP